MLRALHLNWKGEECVLLANEPSMPNPGIAGPQRHTRSHADTDTRPHTRARARTLTHTQLPFLQVKFAPIYRFISHFRWRFFGSLSIASSEACPLRSVVVSMTCRQRSPICAFFQAMLDPTLRGSRSAVTALSQVFRGRPAGLFHFLGGLRSLLSRP